MKIYSCGFQILSDFYDIRYYKVKHDKISVGNIDFVALTVIA